MRTSRAVFLSIIAPVMFGLVMGCQRSTPRPPPAGERITRATPVDTSPADTPGDTDQIVLRSTGIIDAFAAEAGGDVLYALFEDAAGLAVIPGLAQASFAAAGHRGHGVFLARRQTGWSLPVFVTILGSSLGYQIGSSSTDLLLVFRDPETVSRLERQGDVVLGAGLKSALGPIGPSANLSFIDDAEVVAYKRTEGEFVGFHIPGGVLSLFPEMTLAYSADPEQGAVRGYYADEAERLVDGLLGMDERAVPEVARKTNARRLKLAVERLASGATRGGG